MAGAIKSTQIPCFRRCFSTPNSVPPPLTSFFLPLAAKHFPFPLSYSASLGPPVPTSRGSMGRCRERLVQASLFGVGAPEALVIGIVSLLVFGPQGLAEIARNLGKSLRAFQPTIKELQKVSQEFKSILEHEIGLDEVVSPTNKYRSTSVMSATPKSLVNPNGSQAGPITTEETLKVTEEQFVSISESEQEEESLKAEEYLQDTLIKADDEVPPSREAL